MSVSGSGTQADPYVVTTYADLVTYCAESSKYVKLANNIDIYDEFPEGNPTQLVINGSFDGDNKTINHMTRTDSTIAVIINNGGFMTGVNFKNIMTAISFCRAQTPNQTTEVITNCSFSGNIEDGYVVTRNSGNNIGAISRCAFNVEGNMLRLFADYTTTAKNNLYVKMKTNDTSITEGNAGSRNYTFNNCYFDVTAPNLANFINVSSAILVNCALDIKTNASVTIGTGSSGATSIINGANGPNITAAGNCVKIPEGKWLDAEYLYNAGFDIIVPTEGE